MSQPNIREIIKQELVKCAQDPKYFMKKYCVVQHPMRGKVPFHLYPYQETCVDTFNQDDKYCVILKSRQLGLSTLSAGYALWLMTFHSDKNILVIATKQETAKNLVAKVRVMHNELPSWLKNKCVEDNKLSLKYENGSQIKAVSSNSDSARSEALSLLIIDEAAFIDKIDEIWTSAQQTLATGGRAIMLSTPNGVGNLFHRTWVEAENGSDDWNFIRLPWDLHPERDEVWRKKQDDLLGPKMAAQECDCDFVTSGQTVIDGGILQWYDETFIKEPVEKQGFDSNLWIWEQPDYTRGYLVCADTARGDGSDYSALHVIDTENLVQVAEYRGQVSTKDFGNLCVEVATKYNDALLVMENASIGWAAIQQVIDRGYRNLFYATSDLQYVDTEHQMSNKFRALDKKMVAGFSMTMKTRPLVIAKLEEYFREKSVKIYSKRLLDELWTFIYHNNKAEAMKGYHDDLVLSFCIGLWVRDTALRLQSEQMDLTKSSLTNIQSYAPVYSPTDGQKNPYEMDTGKEKEDLKWLLG